MPEQYWICKECNHTHPRRPVECERCGHTAFQESDTDPAEVSPSGESDDGDDEGSGWAWLGGVDPFDREFRPYLMGALLALCILLVSVLLLQL